MTQETPPWGHWTVLFEDSDCKVKKVVVHPGHRLSYQQHHKRYETWVIISGNATVTLEDTITTYTVGDVIRIPIEARHRIANTGTVPLVFIEVQQGVYFGEDDIVRLSDDYSRT